MKSSYANGQKRDAIIGIDPLLNAYFITLVENGQEIGDPLLFVFQGEDDSPSAQEQAQRLKHLKSLWLEQTGSFDDLSRLHGSSSQIALSA